MNQKAEWYKNQVNVDDSVEEDHDGKPGNVVESGNFEIGIIGANHENKWKNHKNNETARNQEMRLCPSKKVI